MDETTVSSGAKTPVSTQDVASAANAGIEHRQAYGTAKTENLRDSGWWRILLPTVVGLFCLALLAFPIAILSPLLAKSFDPTAAANVQHTPLTWIWITMIVVEVAIAVVIVWGLLRIFMTQAGNYRNR